MYIECNKFFEIISPNCCLFRSAISNVVELSDFIPVLTVDQISLDLFETEVMDENLQRLSLPIVSVLSFNLGSDSDSIFKFGSERTRDNEESDFLSSTLNNLKCIESIIISESANVQFHFSLSPDHTTYDQSKKQLGLF